MEKNSLCLFGLEKLKIRQPKQLHVQQRTNQHEKRTNPVHWCEGIFEKENRYEQTEKFAYGNDKSHRQRTANRNERKHRGRAGKLRHHVREQKHPQFWQWKCGATGSERPQGRRVQHVEVFDQIIPKEEKSR